jgi:Zn-dependent protease with chaperone function
VSGAALALLVLGVLLAEPVPRILAAASWPARAPRPALVLWQAVGLAAGVTAIGAGIVYGLAPLGDSLTAAVRTLLDQTAHGHPLAGLAARNIAALLAAAALGLRLLGVLLLSAYRTTSERRRHRALVDLLGTPSPDLGGARVLDHPDAVAYCLPGLRSRVVLSAGVLRLLDADEVAAVLAHERAHLSERHDLVMLPFVAWAGALPFLPGVRRARVAVAGLVEMVADDRARAVADPTALAGAIARLGTTLAPRGGLAVAESAVIARVARLLDAQPPVAPWIPAAAYLGALTLLCLPPVLLLGA